MSKQQQYEKQINQMIDRYKASGHAMSSLNKMMKGKTVKDYSRNINTFNEFKKVIKRARERKSILEESRAITNRMREERVTRTTGGKLGELYRLASKTSKEMAKEVQPVVGRKSLTRFKTQLREHFPQFIDFTTIKSEDRMTELIYEMHSTPILEKAKELTRDEIINFLNKYFVEIELDMGVQDRLEKIADHFGGDYAKMTQFMNYVSQPQFTGEYDSDSMRDDIEGYHQEMLNRLGKMESLLQTKREFRKRKGK